jgi:FtsP/CotA-like multicopper oxidase with cupredoxin domain
MLPHRISLASAAVLLCLVPAVGIIASGEAPSPSPGKVRTYYIAADNVDWNYAPDLLPLIPRYDSDLIRLPKVKLKTFTKAVYHEYTDASFQTQKVRPPEWEHLGMLGPLIRAEVGDTIKVVFKNNTNILCTMHPHGLSYDKDSEGAYYFKDGLTLEQKKGDAVRPHECFTYTWTVPESAGPGPHDPSSILWMYHSHFLESRDINSGLFGPIIVTRQGYAKPDGTPKDVDREFVVAFAVYDESESAYFLQNFVRRERTPAATMYDPNFRQSILFYTMNGLTFGNLPMLTMKKGEHVRWYLFSSSNEDDVHSPHWHGQTVISNMMRTDTLSLGPMAMAVADMIPSNVGIWLFHCHVNDHLDRGMVARFTVTQ